MSLTLRDIEEFERKLNAKPTKYILQSKPLKFQKDVSFNDDTNFEKPITILGEPLATAEKTFYESRNENEVAKEINTTSSTEIYTDESPYARFGSSISLDNSGDLLLFGASKYSVGEGVQVGLVAMFKKNGNNWEPKSEGVYGESDDDFFGFSSKISGNGKMAVVGAPQIGPPHDSRGDELPFGDPTGDGYVRVYEIIYDEAENDYIMTQKGQTIVGDSGVPGFGYSVSISDDGKTIAVGSIFYNEGNGKVCVYKLKSNRWEKIGKDLESDDEFPYTGQDVSLSYDGSRVVFSSTKNLYNVEPEELSDFSKISGYQNNGGKWELYADPIIINIANSGGGYSISTSKNCEIVAVGIPYSSPGPYNDANGFVQVYKFSNGKWNQMGSDIRGKGEASLFGSSVSLSADGMTLGVGTGNADLILSFCAILF